jgi:4-amino-4-deoxy-L-arabinose transferase-like glycosyltransferase
LSPQPAFLKELKPDRFAPLLLLVITILGAGLRLFQIGSKGLWLDEAFSVWMGQQPLLDMFAWLLRVDQHPPLYYTLLHFWLWLGDDAAMVRAFSAIIGTLTIPIIYLLGRRLAGWQVGLVAALILAVSPFHIRFAQETRMYTLLTFNASVAMLALARLLTDSRAATIPLGRQLVDFYRYWRATQIMETKQVGYQQDFRESAAWLGASTRQRWLPLRAIETDLAWLGLSLFTVATLLSHNTAIFFPIAINLFVFGLIFFRKSRPGSNANENQPERQSNALSKSKQSNTLSKSKQSFDAPTPFSEERLQPPSLKNWLTAQVATFLLWSPWLVAFTLQAAGVDREFWISAPNFNTVMWTLSNFLSATLPQQVKWGGLVWYLCSLILLLGLIHFYKKPAHLALLLLLFSTPLVGEWLVSLRRPIFYDRTLIWSTIPLYLLLAAGVMQLRHRPYILAGIIMLVILNGFSLREYFFNFEKEQWDEAAAHVADRVGAEDLLLFNATWVQIPFDFYFRRYNRPVEKHGVPTDLFDRGILEPKMTRDDLPRMRDLIRDHDRVWLIYSHNWYTDPDNLIPAALGRELKLLDQQNFVGLEVRLYGVP